MHRHFSTENWLSLITPLQLRGIIFTLSSRGEFAQSVGCIINYNHASNSQKSINETGGGQVKSAREKRSDLARVRNGHLEGLARLKPQNRFVVKVHLLEELTADDCVEGRCAGDDDDENSSRQSVTTVAWNCMTKRCQNEKPATN